MDNAADADIDKAKLVKSNPEQAVEESPSLGMHAQGMHAVDMGGTSGDENWLGSVDNSIDSPAAAAAALMNEDNHDLPCADAGDAHAVDLTPEESPSPLPPGVWSDNPGSGTSISLPQLDGRASRDSTPRMCTGGAMPFSQRRMHVYSLHHTHTYSSKIKSIAFPCGSCLIYGPF